MTPERGRKKTKKYVSELIGTAVLGMFACGTAAVLGCDKGSAGIAYLATAIAFGLCIVAMACSIGNISGCHINPAVSLAILVSGRMNVKDFIGYIIAQFTGGIAGAAFLSGFIGKDKGLGANNLNNGSVWLSLGIEIVRTGFVRQTAGLKPGMGTVSA